MKLFLTGVVLLATMLQQKCNNEQNNSEKTGNTCYKGRLEVKGLCSNYTIALLEGNIENSKIEASWTDETTGKAYKNVFALASPCTFPETINEGQEFYFTLATGKEDCMVCQAYYPKPSKALAIKVVDKSCK